jgi:hypothetical protein
VQKIKKFIFKLFLVKKNSNFCKIDSYNIIFFFKISNDMHELNENKKL